MSNKVLVKLIVPEVDESFDIFIPTNELMWKIKRLLIKSINDLVGSYLDPTKEYLLINKTTCEVYQNNITVYYTNIRNATELIFISAK